MVEVGRPAGVDSAPIAKSISTQKRRVPVKRAMDEALKLYNAGKFESAERLCAQIVAGRPRMEKLFSQRSVGKNREITSSPKRLPTTGIAKWNWPLS